MRTTDIAFQLSVLSRELKNNGNALSNKKRISLAEELDNISDDVYNEALNFLEEDDMLKRIDD